MGIGWWVVHSLAMPNPEANTQTLFQTLVIVWWVVVGGACWNMGRTWVVVGGGGGWSGGEPHPGIVGDSAIPCRVPIRHNPMPSQVEHYCGATLT